MVLEEQPLGGQKFPEELAAHMAEVAGVDGVEILRFAVGVPQVVQQGGGSCRGHGCAHVVDVLDLVILHPAEGHSPDADARSGGPQQTGSGGGGSPLGCGGADGSIAERGAELTLCRAEMAGRHGQQPVGHPGGTERSPQPQRFGHRAAGPEQPGVRDAQRPQGIVGGRALGLEIPGQHKADLFFGDLCFF